ncbi:MAG: hypothetical protein AC479_05230 [miscellaneous Crenarchaeota group-6 archaeon AD8-1]|nr:MAG: hypothetical protein AC479_05230 [miscellaneous Crenarchaeota group-6 archaeon AD8-1]
MKKNKESALATITIILILIMAAITTLPIVSAHDPPLEIPTYPYLVVSPNPVGVDQPLMLLMWIHGAPPTASGIAGDRYYFTITVTKPDSTTQTLGPMISDATGSTYTTFTPTMIGEHTFTLNYPGQVISLYHPENGLPGQNSNFINDTLLPSSTSVKVTVQEDPIEKIPPYPLPSEYWIRPIEGQNTAWASLGSHWLGGGHIGYVYGGSIDLFQNDGTAPNSPHVMWTMPIEFGGVVGGTTEIPEMTFYSGGSYEGRFTYALSMYGNVYFMTPLNHAGGSRNPAGGYLSVDMRTGETNWESNQITQASGRPLVKGQLFDYESLNQHGVVAGTIWEEVGTTWLAYDAYTGQPIYNLTDVPRGTEVYTKKGEIVRYVLDYGDRRLLLWNNTQDQVGLHGALGTGSSAYQWRPIGKEVNMSMAYSWNVSIPDLPGDSSPAIVGIIPGDIILGRSSSFPGLGGRREEPQETITMWALSDKPADRGRLVWIKDYPAPDGMLTVTLGPLSEEARVFTLSYAETFEWVGYDLDTGNQIWGPSGDDDFNALQYYGGGEGAGQKGFEAYGNLYVQGYGGEIHCYDMENGDLLWEYNNTNSGVETIWGNYPIFIAGIADEKVYVFNNEHSPNSPYYKGEKVRCLDAFTGEELWTLLGWAGQTGGRGTSTAVIADGFLSYYSYYDNSVYCIGKGPSATTIEAPLTAVTQGDSLVITGSVTDQSPGARDSNRQLRFPSGVPAVADESMSAWMEYVYMQKPMPMDTMGVEVVLEVLDANGNFYEIGRTTTDSEGKYGLLWQPEIPGKYMVVASFLGSESYWGSHTSTYVGVVESDSGTDGNGPSTTPSDNTSMYILGSTIAIIAAIGIAAFFILRKK